MSEPWLTEDTVHRTIHRQRRRHEVQDADVAIQIERALDLRQVVLADERLLVDEQHRDAGDAGEVDPAEVGHRGQRGEAAAR